MAIMLEVPSLLLPSSRVCIVGHLLALYTHLLIYPLTYSRPPIGISPSFVDEHVLDVGFPVGFEFTWILCSNPELGSIDLGK